MSVTRFERSNSFKTQVAFYSGSSYVDPSGNMAHLIVYAPDGTEFLSGISGVRVSEGIYKYYIQTTSTDDLGLYIIDWYGNFNYGNPWDYEEKHEKEVIQLVNVIQS